MRRFLVELNDDAFMSLGEVARRQRRAVQDQAAVMLEDLLEHGHAEQIAENGGFEAVPGSREAPTPEMVGVA